MASELTKRAQTLAEIIAAFTAKTVDCPVISSQPLPESNDDVVQTLQQALTAARDSRDWVAATPIAEMLGLIAFNQGNLSEARQRLEEAVSFLRTLDQKPALAKTLGNLAVVTYYAGDAARALESAQEATALAAEAGLGSRLLHGYLLCEMAAIQCYLGRYQAGAESFEQAYRIMAQEEDEVGIAWWQYMRAREEYRDKGQYALAITQVKEALPVLREKTVSRVVVENLLILADSQVCVGELSAAEETLRDAENLITTHKLYWHRPELSLIRARWHFAKNTPQEASKPSYRGLGLAGDQGDLRMLASLYRMIATSLESDRTRNEDAQDALNRSINIGQTGARRIDLALALQQNGLLLKGLANRPAVRARSAGFLLQAEQMLTEMGIAPTQGAAPTASPTTSSTSSPPTRPSVAPLSK